MKIAQALNLRKKLKNDIEQGITMIQAQSVRWPGDDEPEESVDELMAKVLSARKSLSKLICDLNASNNFYNADKGLKISQAIVERETLKAFIQSLGAIHVNPPRQRTVYDSNSKPVSQVCTLMISADGLRRIVNQAAADMRKLDDMIQQANWTNDLIES